MSKDKVKEGVKKVFIELFPELRKGKFDFKKSQGDFKDWDSFMHMKLVSKLEEQFNLNLDIAEALDADSPLKFSKLISKNTKNEG